MTGTAGPRHGLVWGYLPGESGWGVGGFNPNFAKLDALVHLTVIAVAATPPTTPANGDCYIVAASPTGAWVGHADDIAVYYTAGGWLYIDPAVGVRAFDRSADLYVRFDGIDWIDEIAPAADVAGPVSSVDGHIAVYDGTTGKVIKDDGKALPSGLVVGDSDEQVLTNKLIQGADNNLSVRLNADVVGNLPVSHLNGGVGASNTTVWHGDGAWRVPAGGGGGGGGASVTVSETPPADPVAGQLWFDAASACMFVWYEDSTAGAWVVAVNVGTSAGGSGTGVMSMTATEPMTISSPTGDVVVGMECPLEIEYGGTGAETAAQALVNLGAAPILSPVLLGAPTGPTASPGTSNGQLATTAFVGNALSTVGDLTLKEDKANKGVASGYASLDASAKVPAAQLPSYVDDVLEYANLAAFPSPGSTGIIYAALDTNKIYRWSGSAYVEISPSPGSTDSVPEGSTNLYYTAGRASAVAPVQTVAGRTGAVVLTKTDVALGNVDNTSDVNKPISTATQTALDLKAPLASPVFTGDARSVTPATSDNDTSIATTAYVKAQGYVIGGPYLPLAGGTLTGNLITTSGIHADGPSSTLDLWDDGNSHIESSTVLWLNGNSAKPTRFGGAAIIAGNLGVSGNLDVTGRLTTDATRTYATSTASDAFYVQTVTGADAYIHIKNGTTGTWKIGTQGSSFQQGYWYIYDVTRSALRLSIDTAGACFNGSGSWTAISDRRLKVEESILPYERGLEELLQLSPVMFRYKAGTPFAPIDEPSDVHIGLIAEDVEEVMPEIVGTSTATVDGEEREVKVLTPTDLTYCLINSVRELEARVRELEARPPNPPEQPA